MKSLSMQVILTVPVVEMVANLTDEGSPKQEIRIRAPTYCFQFIVALETFFVLIPSCHVDTMPKVGHCHVCDVCLVVLFLGANTVQG